MSNLKLQFGSGGRNIDGFQSFDLDCDITKLPLPFQDGCAETILSSHVVEHVTLRQAFEFFKDCHRILAPDGVLRIIVPTLARIEDRAHAVDLILGHGHQHLWAASSLKAALWAAGFERRRICETPRKEIDQHWKEIGDERDKLESCNVEARKL